MCGLHEANGVSFAHTVPRMLTLPCMPWCYRALYVWGGLAFVHFAHAKTPVLCVQKPSKIPYK